MAAHEGYLAGVEQWRLLQEKWARLDGDARMLEEMQKSLLAELTNQYAAGNSVAKAEVMARSHERYLEHVRKMVQARTEANIAKSYADAKKMGWESWRSAEATRREEAKLIR